MQSLTGGKIIKMHQMLLNKTTCICISTKFARFGPQLFSCSFALQSLAPHVIGRVFFDYLEVRAATRPLLIPVVGTAAPPPLGESTR
jgi:hypothetical protein